MGVLLYLAQDALRLKHFSLTELELGLVQVGSWSRWFLMRVFVTARVQPQWSETLASIFVGLLLPFDTVTSQKSDHKFERESVRSKPLRR